MALHKWGYKLSREFARRMPSYRGEVAGCHPAFSETSQLHPKQRAGPVSIDEADFKYTDEDEKAIEDYVRKTVGTAWHSVRSFNVYTLLQTLRVPPTGRQLGTCAMKPREKGGVVDERLNVYGTDRLKVVDMSIAPGNVGAVSFLLITDDAPFLTSATYRTLTLPL